MVVCNSFVFNNIIRYFSSNWQMIHDSLDIARNAKRMWTSMQNVSASTVADASPKGWIFILHISSVTSATLEYYIILCTCIFCEHEGFLVHSRTRVFASLLEILLPGGRAATTTHRGPIFNDYSQSLFPQMRRSRRMVQQMNTLLRP